jgi:uncharacterized protein YyaL (SSP411 family)
MPLMVANIALWHGGGTQIVLTGDPAGSVTRELEAVVARHHIPWAVVVPPGAASRREALTRVLPWTAGMGGDGDAPSAYVCDDFTCQLPVSTPEVLGEQLQALLKGKRVGG